MTERARVAAKAPEAKRENKSSHTQSSGFSHPSPIEQILFLQRTIGNEAVGRLINSGALQSKLRISQPGDKFEQEAERTANAVVNMTGGAGSKERESQGSVQKKALDKSSNVNPVFQGQSGQSAGSPLPGNTRSFMEPRFGAGFGDVRIHTDRQAAEMTKAVNAKAFTTGKDIYFGENQYSPGTDSGDRLIAHELTHTLQQRSLPSAQIFSQGLPALTAQNADQIYRKPAKAESSPGGETAPGVMELKGKDKFEPPDTIASFLEGRDASTVNVRFGNMAQGPINVAKKSRGKYEIDRQAVSLAHPFFAGMAKPNLILYTKGGAVNGHIGFGTGKNDQELASLLKKSPDMLGLAGFDLNRLPAITNRIEGGSLHLGIKGGITLGGAFSGNIDLEAIDEKVNFAGSVRIKVEKLATGELELKRSGEGLITGKGSVELAQVKNFTGKVDVAWDGQAITGEGKAGYQGEKFSGEVTLKVMERSMAQQLEQSEKPPPKEIAVKETKSGKADYVVYGEGDLNFSFTEWLTGTAHVIVDHRGNLTIIGKITPQKEVILFEQKDYNKQLFKVEARASYGVPIVGNIFIFANVGMDAFANIGPGKLYNIVVEGTYSTDPTKSKSFSIQGSLNISAAAGLRLRGEAGAGLEILAHDIKAGAGINGIAGIKGYAEATPVIGYREKAKEGEDKKGEFFIRGDLEIAAQPFLGLSGDLFAEVDAPWWSPCPDKRWTWPLFNKEWPIGGSLGIGASVDYVFGSGVPPSVDFKPVDFSAEKFMTDMYSDKAQGKSGEKEPQKGKWGEKNSKAAEPPPRTAKEGNAKLGKSPEKAGAKSKVQPGTTKKSNKPVDPNARTKDGKKVKELQDEAARKGKKPEGREPKGKGEEKGKPEDKEKNVKMAKDKVKSELKTKLPKGAKQAADVNKVLDGIAPKVKPILSNLHAEEVMPGKPKNEGAIGFKVKGKEEKGGDALIDSVRYSQEGGVISHEERWKKGVEGVAKAINKLKSKGISEKTIRAQFPAWESEFGFKHKSLTLKITEKGWILEGEMSPGKPIVEGKENLQATEGGIQERFKAEFAKMDELAAEYSLTKLKKIKNKKIKQADNWKVVREGLLKYGMIFKQPLSLATNFGKERTCKHALSAVESAVEEVIRKEKIPPKAEFKNAPKKIVKKSQPKVNKGSDIFETSKIVLQEYAFDKRISPVLTLKNAYIKSDELKNELGLGLAELVEIVEMLKSMKNVPGNESLIGYILSNKIKPQYKHGFIFQTQRAIEYYKQGLLKSIETKFEDPKTGRISRYDLIIIDPENKSIDDGSVIEVIVEVKNWAGFESWDRKEQDARLLKLVRQLKKYKKTGKPIQLDWKGKVPERVKNRVENIEVKINLI